MIAQKSRNKLKIRFRNKVENVLFIPYAEPAPDSYDSYTEKIRKAMETWGVKVTGIHESSDEVKAVKSAQAIFVGGGNTFLLLKMLYDKHLVEAIRIRVLEDGIPYIGSSAGTVVATASINTTNDMPIVLPPTFYALQLTPFNINPHFPEHDVEAEREERIVDFQYLSNNPVLGLRAGSALLVEGKTASLVGDTPARLFQRGEDPQEFPVGTDFSFLFN